MPGWARDMWPPRPWLENSFPQCLHRFMPSVSSSSIGSMTGGRLRVEVGCLGFDVVFLLPFGVE